MSGRGARDDDERQAGKLLGWIGAASGCLFVVSVALVVILQTVLPTMGLEVGTPSDWVIGSMLVFALITFGLLPAAAFLRRDK